MDGPQGRPTTRRRTPPPGRPLPRTALPGTVLPGTVLLGTVLLAACGGPAASSPAAAPAATNAAASAAPAASAAAADATAAPAQAPASSAGTPPPVACTSVSTQGSFSSASAAAPVTLAQIGQAVGFTVSLSMPDTQSALGFNGYEGCRYQFSTPAGGAQEDVVLVVGTNPLDGKSAAAEYAATSASKLPLSERQSNCSGCGYSFTSVAGLGGSALKGYQDGGDEVVVALQGRVYVEIGPGDLKESRMVQLAQLILSKVR